MRTGRLKPLLLIAALAMLGLRALTPEGYMPGSPGSGLLFELCPAGVPAGIVQALGGGHHHHHDGSGRDTGDQCPIGHMLSAAAATDSQPHPLNLPGATEFEALPTTLSVSVVRTAYRSRAPPA